MLRLFLVITCLSTFLGLASCGPVSEVDNPLSEDVRRLPYPSLSPTQTLVADIGSARLLTSDRETLTARAQALQSRANSLESEMDEATRQRLAEGVGAG